KEQRKHQKAFDVNIHFKTKKTKIIENTEEKTDDEQREQHEPQISPHDRQKEDCAKCEIKVIVRKPQKIQDAGNKNKIEHSNGSPDIFPREPPPRHQHKDNIADGKGESKSKYERKPFGPDVAEESKIRG